VNESTPELRQQIARRHHVIGWWALLAFLSLGIVLETLHGFRLLPRPGYRLRRLLWTLAHAHGTLL
jgi:uncharacterized membrane protein